MRRSRNYLNYDRSLMRGDCQAARFPILPLPNLQRALVVGETWPLLIDAMSPAPLAQLIQCGKSSATFATVGIAVRVPWSSPSAWVQ